METIKNLVQSNPITISEYVGDYVVALLPNSNAAVVVETNKSGDWGLACPCCTHANVLVSLQKVAQGLGAEYVLWSWKKSQYPKEHQHFFPEGTPNFISDSPLKGRAPIEGTLMDMVKWDGTTRSNLKHLIELDSRSPEIIRQLE